MRESTDRSYCLNKAESFKMLVQKKTWEIALITNFDFHIAQKDSQFNGSHKQKAIRLIEFAVTRRSHQNAYEAHLEYCNQDWPPHFQDQKC